MNITPEIPQLDPSRVQVRKHALLNAIEEKPRRRWWRIAVPATVLAAAAVATTVLWTPTNPSAYASWTAEPRAPGPNTDGMIATCREKLAERDQVNRRDFPNFPPMPTELTLIDQRGDLTMVLFTGPYGNDSCLRSRKGIEAGGGGRNSTPIPALGSKRFRMASVETLDPEPGYGEPRRTVLAEVGPDVAKAVVNTEDGKQVAATLGNGWMIAWWPGRAGAVSITLYGRGGEVLGTESPEVKAIE
ncbi:hypothetical protein UK23_42205 [Lentzea aerocolonigenes]|uniref:Uncharacterized protein n=1 Tax=Lentzea aerocolonigenes TaxID=68170 RepID=A0A0F0GDM8_LENAE|nr:hypothetical protein [Lentzea aerocolonigenes]KJK36337.1 hypothetical protein UK23_42205 [Lentzea aerocolonigenes]